MIKCKQAENSECGKKICCFECEEKGSCDSVCSRVDLEVVSEPLNDCEDAFEVNDDNAVELFNSKAAEVIKSIAEIVIKKKELEEQEKVMREQLEKAMDEYGIKSFDNDLIKVTYVAPTTKTTIDSKALKKDFPDIAAKYSKVSDVKGSVKITVK